VSFLAPQAELDYQDHLRSNELKWYIGNPEKNLRGHLYDFLIDVLEYDALSETFHKPMLDEWDRMDLRRQRIWMGLEERGTEPIDDLDLWFRGGIKTWCKRGQIIRYYLWDPTCTVTWWHAVEDKAVESGDAIADQLLKNKKLRKLFPAGVLPAMNRKKFCAGGSFRLTGQKIGDAPSFLAMGAGGESTGAHSRVGVLDDFVGYNDVVDGQMSKKKQFYQGTVRNVVIRTAGKYGWVTAIGTHWAIDDPYVAWRESPDWQCRVRACLETDGVPDPNGKPVYLSLDQIEKERREQGSALFSFQMLNDPSPSGEKPWVPAECERTCTIEEAKGPGYVIVLSDPAPFAMGSTDGRDERARRDGTKNWWASVIVKLRMKGERREMILLDGIQSKNWGIEEGMNQTVKLALKWRALEGYCESTSSPVYLDKFLESKKDLGWKGYIIGSRKRFDAEDRLKATYNARAKCNYLIALADRAKQSELIVCESFPLKDEFFGQMRGFMPLPDGRTGIPFDDLANAVSFGTDPYFRSKYHAVDEDFSTWSPFRKREEDEPASGARYVSW